MRYVLSTMAALGLGLLFVVSVASAFDVQFVRRDGTPVRWGENTSYFGNPPKAGAEFKVELPQQGMIFAAGLYRIRIAGGKPSSPDSQVRIDGKSIVIDARAIDESLRCATGLAWSGGQLHVAEWHSNDGADRYIYDVTSSGALGDRRESVLRPTALAVSNGVAYVLGSQELAAVDLAKRQRLWSIKSDTFGEGAAHVALVDDRLYVTCPARQEIAVVDARTGSVTKRFPVPGASAEPVKPGGALPIDARSTLPIAASPATTLLVGLKSGVIEISTDGKLLRKIAEVPYASALAVSPRGDIALAAPGPYGAFYVLRMDRDGKSLSENRPGRGGQEHFAPKAPQTVPDPDGSWIGSKPLVKIMRTTWNDFGEEPCDRRYFAGLAGKLHAVGGLAFDDAENLYAADRNDVLRADGTYQGRGNDMGSDGGIVKLSPAGQVVARLGSRFTDGAFEKARLAERVTRDPMLRTRELLQRGGRQVIVVCGDSITQVGGDWNGGASDTQHNWTMLLPRLIAARQPAAKVLIEARGIGGNNVYNGLCRAPQPEQVELNATLYLLEFGTNDVNRPWMPPDRYADGLRDFVHMLFVYTDSDVALVTTGPLPGENLRDPAEYHKAVVAVAAEFKLPVVDMTAAVNEALAGRDYTTLHLGNEPNRKKTDPHPNTAGHAVWAEATIKTLERAMSQPTP